MREAFCPFVCTLCEYAVFNECAALKQGNWEILGKGVQVRCRAGTERDALGPGEPG
jgi:hypothetical protein